MDGRIEAISASTVETESVILSEKVMNYFSSLMRVGFGEVGAEIIGRKHNMVSAGKGSE